MGLNFYVYYFVYPIHHVYYDFQGIAVEGPSEAEITCHDNKDGTCTVDYIPTEEGDYDVNVKFGDEHIPGSPFKVKKMGSKGAPAPPPPFKVVLQYRVEISKIVDCGKV